MGNAENESHAPGERRAAANAAFLLGTNAGRILFNAALFFVIARVLGAAELGRYSFAVSYAALFAVVVHLGLNDLIIRQVAVRRADGPRYFTLALIVKSVLGVVITAVTALAVAASGKPAAVQEMVLAAALTATLVTGLETIVVSFFYAHERMAYVLTLSVVKSGLNAAVGIGAALAGWGARGILWGFLGVETVCAVLVFVWARHKLDLRFVAVRAAEFPRLLFQSLPFALNGVFITIYQQLHYSLLSFFVGDVATGVFTAAAKLITFLNFIPSALTQALYPYLSRLAAGAGPDPRPPMMRWARYLALISFPTGLYFLLRAPAVVNLVYGTGYGDAARILAVLGLTIPFTFATYPFAVALNAIHRERANTAVVAGAAVINVAANLTLIPRLGALGAAYALLATEASQSVARLILVRRWMGPLGAAVTFLRVAAPLVPVALALLFLPVRGPVYVEIPCVAALYLAGAFATRALRLDDVRNILHRPA